MTRARAVAFAALLALPASLALAGPPVVAKTPGGPPAGDKTTAMPTKRPSDHDGGKRLYEQSCWQCHGDAGRGDGPAANDIPGGVPSLAGKLDPKQLDALVKVIQDGRGRMPAYSEDIDRHDSRRILVYLREKMDGVKTDDAPDAGDDEEAGGQ
jgi:mono/diheme cytochrome c family protein